MFDTLVESRSDTAQTAKSSAYFGVTTIVLASLFLALFIVSIFSESITLGEEDLALNTLVAPVPVPDNAPPPPPAPENKPQQKAADENAPKNVDLLRDPVENIDQPTAPPDKASTDRSNADQVRPGVAYVQSNTTSRASGGGSDAPVREGGGGGGGGLAKTPAQPVQQEEEAPAAPKPTPAPKPPSVVSGGVVNGKASNLVKPPYPPAAKAVKAAGAVNVQVLIDENGSVVSANATSGHPLLRAAAVQAARASRFTPTTLSGQKVKVSGVIVYNFVAQ